jgi:hypothetical protein
MHRRDEKYVQNLGPKPEGKRPLGITRHRWEDNIRTDVRGTGWEGVDQMHLVQDKNQ